MVIGWKNPPSLIKSLNFILFISPKHQRSTKLTTILGSSSYVTLISGAFTPREPFVLDSNTLFFFLYVYVSAKLTSPSSEAAVDLQWCSKVRMLQTSKAEKRTKASCFQPVSSHKTGKNKNIPNCALMPNTITCLRDIRVETAHMRMFPALIGCVKCDCFLKIPSEGTWQTEMTEFQNHCDM